MVFLQTHARETSTNTKRWHSNLQQAMQEARQLNKPVIIHFYADWCGPCRKMDKAVLHSPELLNQFGSRFVGLKVNSDHHRNLADKLGVRSLPTDVFMHPDGWMIQKSSGFKGKRDYFHQLAQVESIFQQAERMSLASDNSKKLNGPILIPFEKPKQNPFKNPADSNTSEKSKQPKTPSADSQSERKPKSEPITKLKLSKPEKPTGRIVGLSAFSPVTLKDARKWVRGTRKFSETYRGITYYMQTAAEARRFRNTPEVYVPQYLGCDPVLLKQKQQMVPGSTRYAAMFSNRLYLFSKPEHRKQFRASPQKYIRIRHQFTIKDFVE